MCVIFTLILLLSLSAPAFAADDRELTQEQKEALYAKYEEMVAAANKKYGLDISVLPFDEIETFYSEEEMAQILDELRGFLTEATVHVGGDPLPLSETGYTVVTVCDTVTNRHGKNVSVNVDLYGTFEIVASLDGGYEIRSQNFNAYAESDDLTFYYVLNGYGSITGYADGGRTLIVTQTFDLYVDNDYAETVTAKGYFYFNKTSGAVCAL